MQYVYLSPKPLIEKGYCMINVSISKQLLQRWNDDQT